MIIFVVFEKYLDIKKVITLFGARVRNVTFFLKDHSAPPSITAVFKEFCRFVFPDTFRFQGIVKIRKHRNIRKKERGMFPSSIDVCGASQYWSIVGAHTATPLTVEPCAP